MKTSEEEGVPVTYTISLVVERVTHPGTDLWVGIDATPREYDTIAAVGDADRAYELCNSLVRRLHAICSEDERES
jgi:hypothetical protein